MLPTALPTVGAQARLAVAGLLVVMMVYWLVRRLVFGRGDDATIRASSSSETGSLSFLVSGTMAFTLLGVIAGVVLAPEIIKRPVIGVVIAVPIVAAWILNKREVAG